MKKGFTLIELLGVLFILSILALITVPLVQSLITGAGENSQEVQEEAFIKAAKNWAGNNAFSMPEEGESYKLYLLDLVTGGYLEANEESDNYYIKKSGTNENYNLDKACVKIYNNGTATAEYEYEFSEDC